MTTLHLLTYLLTYLFTYLRVDDPTATLEWSKLDGEIPRDAIVDDGTLIIPYVSESHQGTYRCTTTTVVGTSYRQFILTVEGQYRPRSA